MMMRVLIKNCLPLLALLLMVHQMSHAEIVIKPTTVAGFINRGDKLDDSINLILTKSIAEMLTKIPGSIITTVDDLDKAFLNGPALSSLKTQKEKVIRIAQVCNAKQVLFGDYLVDRKTETIVIRIKAVQLNTGEELLRRTYEGSSAIGFFDLVDTIALQVSGILTGKDIVMTPLVLQVSGTDKVCQVYFFGRPLGEVSTQKPLLINMIANEDLEIEYRDPVSGQEIYHTHKTLLPNTTNIINYEPSGSLTVLNSMVSAVLYTNQAPAAILNENTETTLFNLKAGEYITLSLSNKNGTIAQGKVLITERKTVFYSFMNSDGLGKSANYKNSWVPLNLIMPGFAQFQSGDLTAGFVFLALDLGIVAVTAFSVYQVYYYQNLYQTTEDLTAMNYYHQANNWKTTGLLGLGLWGGMGLLSITHALIQRSFWEGPEMKKEISWQFEYTGSYAAFALIKSF